MFPKYVLFLCLFVIIFTSSVLIAPVSAQGITDTYKFGTKKGQEIRSFESINQQIMQEQLKTLKTIVEDQKRILQLLDKQSLGDQTDPMKVLVPVIKELAKATNKQNAILEKILEKVGKE